MPPRRRLRALLGIVVLIVAAGAAGFAAGRAVLPPEAELPPETVAQTYEVADGTVSRSLSMSVIAETEAVPVALAGTSGTVTEILLDGVGRVEAGDVLLRVDERPVIAIDGAVPHYRDLAAGATGRDVEQLQRYLQGLGFGNLAIDGRYGAGTAAAVRQWRRDLGLASGSHVERGLLVAVGTLPATLVLAEEIRVGAPLTEGDEFVLRVQDEPRFVLRLRPEQVNLVPLDSEVIVRSGEARWHAQPGEVTREDADIEIELLAPGGGPPCGDECGTHLAAVGQVVLPAEVVVVPETSGPAVPVAAIQTTADGTTLVGLAGGGERLVEVLAVADGIAIVSGLDTGDVVVLTTAP